MRVLPAFFFFVEFEEILLVIFILFYVEWIVPDVVLLFLLGEHFIEQFLNLLTILTLIPVPIRIPVMPALHILLHHLVQILPCVSHKYVVAALVTLVGFA